MKIGACSPLERIELLEGLGFDQIELGVAYFATLDDAGIQEVKKMFEGRKLTVRSCNCMFPGTITPLYKDEGLVEARAYLANVMPKLKEIGVTTAVFGSGGYRRMPEDIPEEKRHQLIRDLLVVMEEEARKNGVTIVIEPLNRKETNVLTTTKESMEYIRELELPNLKLLVDLYHFYCENEPIDRIYEYGPYIKHVHIAEPTRRDFLREGDEYDYAPFFKALHEVGYDGAVMFEGGQGDCYNTGVAETYPVLKKFCK